MSKFFLKKYLSNGLPLTTIFGAPYFNHTLETDVFLLPVAYALPSLSKMGFLSFHSIGSDFLFFKSKSTIFTPYSFYWQKQNLKFQVFGLQGYDHYLRKLSNYLTAF